jgi:hypothetical protein
MNNITKLCNKIYYKVHKYYKINKTQMTITINTNTKDYIYFNLSMGAGSEYLVETKKKA